MEPRTTCMAYKHSATELRQPAGKQTLQFCIYTVKGDATVSLSTDQRKFSFFSSKDSYYSLNFFFTQLI